MLTSRLLILLMLSVMFVTIIAACAGSSTSSGNLDNSPISTVIPDNSPNDDANLGGSAHGSSGLPSGQLSDWVSYSDQYSVFTILGERQFPLTEAVIDTGSGIVARSVTVRIEYTPWVSGAGLTIAGEFEMLTSGWTISDNLLLPLRINGAERLEVGGLYMAPMVLFETEQGDKWGINSAMLLRIIGDTVASVSGNCRSPRIVKTDH